MKQHFLNLTNGIEALVREKEIENYHFIRIQSTACEQKRWDHILLDLDNHFLMCLALGHECIVYDYSARKEIPRSFYQGMEYIKYVLNKCWFDTEIICPKGMHTYFKEVYRTLKPTTLSKIKYYRKFVHTEELHLTLVSGQTDRDGDYEYYTEILKSRS